MRKFRVEHIPEEWRFFMDGSNSSLKGVLLHNGNQYPSVPVIFGARLKESYDVVKLALEKVNYFKYNWQFCGDFKMISIILGQQGGYTKYPCFLCEWDSRADNDHWTDKAWPSRTNLQQGDLNVTKDPLIDPYKVILPPLHIKLGIMK